METKTSRIIPESAKSSSWRRFFTPRIIVGSIVVYSVAALASSTYFHIKKQSKFKRQYTEEERLQIFDDLAPKYDQKVGWDEITTGINNKRRVLLKNARGRVLETGIGTGRNLLDYAKNNDVNSLVGIEQSENMLDICRAKWKNLEMRYLHDKEVPSEFAHLVGRTRKTDFPDAIFYQMRVEDIHFPDRHFDTVVDTYGLCSYEDPIKALQEMSRVCKKNGIILLLEHGNSPHSFVSWYLKATLPTHTANYGCYWNRDIVQLVKDAGLRVEQARRFHLGSGLMVVARPSHYRPKKSAVETPKAPVEPVETPAPTAPATDDRVKM